MPDEPGPLLAMVALSSERMPDADALVAAFSARAPECEVTEVEAKDGTLFCKLDGDLAFVSLMPAPIPWEDLEGPCATSWWWPEATEVMRGHAFHAIVSLMGGEGDVVDRHLLLTQLVSAVTETTDAVGIYWGAGTVVHEPEPFREQAEGMTRETIQPILWIDPRIEQIDEDEPAFRFFTTGLEAFGHLEIEIDEFRQDPNELFEFLLSIIDYVLTSGKTISAGETIGRTEDERIAVSVGPSIFDRGEVMKFGFA